MGTFEGETFPRACNNEKRKGFGTVCGKERNKEKVPRKKKKGRVFSSFIGEKVPVPEIVIPGTKHGFCWGGKRICIKEKRNKIHHENGWRGHNVSSAKKKEGALYNLGGKPGTSFLGERKKRFFCAINRPLLKGREVERANRGGKKGTIPRMVGNPEKALGVGGGGRVTTFPRS